MSCHVCHGATLQCSLGAVPSCLVVLPAHRLTTNGVPAANILDHQPFVNIQPFGLCRSPANPAVAAATAAAMGVLTPMPCTPVTLSPWAPGSASVLLDNMPALERKSMLSCAFGGQIRVLQEGQFTHQIA